MKQLIFLLLLLLLSASAGAQYPYPPSRTVDSTDTYWGITVKDPYRWMEKIRDPEVQDWFKSQGDFTNRVLEKIPGRDMLFQRIKAIAEGEGDQYSPPYLHGNAWYVSKTLKGETFGKLYKRDAQTGKETLFFDGQAYKKGSQLLNYKINRQGDLMALMLRDEGSELCEIIFMNPVDQSILPDKLYPVWSEFDFDFLADGKSLIYTRMSTSDLDSEQLTKNMEATLHTLGTKPEDDIVLASSQHTPDIGLLPERFPLLTLSDDDQYIFLGIVSVKDSYPVFYIPAAEARSGSIHWKPLIREEDEVTGFYTFGDQLFFCSHKNAPHFKIGVTSLKNPDFDRARILAAYPDKTISAMQATRNFIVFSLSDGITQEKHLIDTKTLTARKIPLPGGVNGSAGGVNPRMSDKIVFMNHNWLTPIAFFEYDAAADKLAKSTWLNTANNFPDYDKLYTVKEVEIPGHDGTLIPLSIIYPKNLKRDGSAPCFMTGYGGYGISMKPFFLGELTAFPEQGGVLAIAHVRGGGEKGERWHKDGMKDKKPNTWKDFISCAEYLVKEKYTSPQKLAGLGASMGGVLIGRAITERPDLFAVAINSVGMTQVLRNETTSNGDNQIPEIGSIKVEKDIKPLVEMDVQSKIKAGVKYPAVLVISGINDSRVAPWMPGKFTAALQNSSASGKPVLIRVNYKAGHFANDREDSFREYADIFAFTLWQTGHPDFQP